LTEARQERSDHGAIVRSSHASAGKKRLDKIGLVPSVLARAGDTVGNLLLEGELGEVQVRLRRFIRRSSSMSAAVTVIDLHVFTNVYRDGIS